MKWTPQQESALRAVRSWLKSGDKPYFQLAGYAGTGKTTLAKEAAEMLDGDVYFASFTGKAAHVLRQHGAPNAETLHKLIYLPSSKSKARLEKLENQLKAAKQADSVDAARVGELERAVHEEQDNLARPLFKLNLDSPLRNAALVVVDEYSMVDATMGEDLLSFGCPVLALGDPAQLPPVRGTPFFSGSPDVLLTEIHRQARDNPIIDMATTVREGGVLKTGNYGSSRVLRRGDVTGEEVGNWVCRSNQLLVGRNKTRQSSNNRARELLGRSGDLPVDGDKLVCLRNNHEAGLLNGQQWWALGDSAEYDGKVALDLSDGNGARVDAVAHPEYFRGGQPDYWNVREAECFDYGYALTVHKAQGSQWDDVLLFDEWRGNNRQQWLYTALTRAAERVTVIKI